MQYTFTSVLVYTVLARIVLGSQNTLIAFRVETVD